MDLVGGKGNEKTTSDGQRVCASVGVFWSPFSQVSTFRGEVAAGRLPSWSRALSLDLPVRTALEFRGLKRARPLLLLPRGHTRLTHTLLLHALRQCSHAQTLTLRAPRAEPPGPLPSSRTPSRCRGSRWRLLALGSRPPDASRQQPAVAPSLPAAAARLGRLARRASCSAVSEWGGSRAAKGHAGAVLVEKEPRSPR